MDEGYPNPKELKQIDLKTLEFLYTNSFINKQFSKLASAAQNYLLTINKPKQPTFIFESELNLLIEGKIRRVIIGANVISAEEKKNRYKHDLVSYSLSICARNQYPFRLIRRFHFDYAVPEKKTRQPIPIFHLQYGGKLSTYLLELGVNDRKIDSWLSIPRLNHYPITLALLLDIIFCEFRSEQTHLIAERSEWRKLVKENEELVVKPYYRTLYQFVQSNAYNDKCLVRDYCHGK